ncbi:MAG: hypothetical protein PVJ33_02675 [Lysobacterales bacterium]|jgi:hypothetical protein
MKLSISTVLFIVLAGIAFTGPLLAQENEGVATVVHITPKPGHEAELVKAITDYHHFVAKFPGHMEYTWYEVLTGPDTGTYLARSGEHNWSDFDAEHDWDDEADAMFSKNVAPHIDHAVRMMTKDMNEFSYWPEDMKDYTHFQLERWYVQSGQYGKFRRGLRKIVDTMKANDFPGRFGFISVASGGPGNQITFAIPSKGWAGMSDKKPSFYDIMSKELGSAEAFDDFMSDWGSTFKAGQNMMVKVMPEASEYSTD